MANKRNNPSVGFVRTLGCLGVGVLCLLPALKGTAAAQTRVVSPLALSTFGEKDARQSVAAQGLQATLTIEPFKQCGVATVWQVANAQTQEACNIARLTLQNTLEPQSQPASFLLTPYGDDAGMSQLQMALYHLDPATAVPQVMVSAYTGGAHCCIITSLFNPQADGTWHETPLGTRDGDGLPRVVDAAYNDTAQIELFDQSFFYMFSSYAGSFAPLILKSFQNGELKTVTLEKIYRPYVQQTLYENTKNWEQSGRSEPNGFLAYYVATKAELGEFSEAWRYMLANKEDAASTQFGISLCDLKPSANKRCSPEEQKVLPFPQGLAAFLEKAGYITAAQRQDVLGQTVASQKMPDETTAQPDTHSETTALPAPDQPVTSAQQEVPQESKNPWLYIVYAWAVMFYCLPIIIAYSRRAEKKHLTLALTLFLGWTLIGWVVALVLAISTPSKRREN